MRYHILLLEDVINHGRKGELVHVKPGFARNFLLPQGRALLVTKTTLKMRDRLQKEREEQAKKDRDISLKLKEKLDHKQFAMTVKVDPDGHMYGSVTAQDIVDLLDRDGIQIDKRVPAMAHPIKQIGMHPVTLRLPEGVEASIALELKPDRPIKKKESVSIKQEEAESSNKVEEKVEKQEEETSK